VVYPIAVLVLTGVALDGPHSCYLAGLMIGLVWYVALHDALQRWPLRRGDLPYEAKLRHAGQHAGRHGNFGVTTGFWDRALGTVIARDPARSSAQQTRRHPEELGASSAPSVSKDGNKLGACCHPSRRPLTRVSGLLRVTAVFVARCSAIAEVFVARYQEAQYGAARLLHPTRARS
jgi:hypothetical protein